MTFFNQIQKARPANLPQRHREAPCKEVHQPRPSRRVICLVVFARKIRGFLGDQPNAKMSPAITRQPLMMVNGEMTDAILPGVLRGVSMMILMGLLAGGCRRPPNEFDLADPALTHAATNDIVGFTRIIDSQIDYGNLASVTNWRGRITAEFVNPVGGVTRTNLVYSFLVFTNDGRVSVLARIDPAWEMEVRKKRFEAELDKAGTPTH